MWDYFAPYRQKREYYMQNPNEVREILNAGANKAHNIAAPMMEKIRMATGVRY
jgi:tryptophanyl-tRNA synthetase